MNFGSKGNRTVQKTVLIGECQVLKTEKGGNQILKSTFLAKIPFLSFQRLYFEACLLFIEQKVEFSQLYDLIIKKATVWAEAFFE